LDADKLSDLYVTLPTRDGTLRDSKEPKIGDKLEYGHHLVFFTERIPERFLRSDSTDPAFSPPAPFERRMWAGGSFSWDNSLPLRVGDDAVAQTDVDTADIKFKGQESDRPMTFVSRHIRYYKASSGASKRPSISEKRTHVFLPEGIRPGPVREVKNIPPSYDFAIDFLPTPTTLFRFSALTFNAHQIHLDKAYAQIREHYPERLVHGPLTALMLLEYTGMKCMGRTIRSFEYRAENPFPVGDACKIYGVATDKDNLTLWCKDANIGAVVMTGSVVF
ncbi:hypothetical protein FISHEDRAFT_10860, partial [Fistulina hepatica ATCC 64428]